MPGILEAKERINKERKGGREGGGMEEGVAFRFNFAATTPQQEQEQVCLLLPQGFLKPSCI